MTECTPSRFTFQDLGARQVVAAFDGGTITSDGGALLLRAVDDQFRFLERFAGCFTDHRDPERTEHSLVELLKQRVFGICLGYGAVLDHDRLRHDPLLAVLVGKDDPLGEARVREADRGKALAGKSTLNRLELTAVGADADSRYQKIVAHTEKIEDFLVETFLLQHTTPPQRIVLDLDATDDPLHGHQLGRFFNAYYGHYCYLPLYIFCGDHPLGALLRPSDADAAAGSLRPVQRLVARIRQAWPQVEIVLRGDMENRIKEQQLSLFADDLCCETMRANQVRLYFSTVAYVVMRALRQFGLKDTEMAKAQCGTIREKLFKIGGLIRVSVRRVVLALSEAFPFQALFAKVWQNLRTLAAPTPLAEPTPTG